MGRFVRTVLAIAVLGIAGCGGDGADPSVVRVAVEEPLAAEPAAVAPAQPKAGPAAVEPTDGRLGAATAIRAGSPLRELSPGGRPDVRRRGDGPRRDGVGAGAACPDADLAPSGGTPPALAEATLCLLNGERADHGLAPLAPNGRLAAAATAHAGDLVAGSYFSHTGRDGSDVLDRIERSGYIPRGAAWVLGENLAWGTGGLATPAAIMQAWVNSPGHRENVLDPSFREVGVGIVAGNPASADGLGATYATEFGAIEGAVAQVAKPRSDAQRARKGRKRARRHGAARRARASRRGGAWASGRHRGRAGRVTARLAL